MRTEQLNARAAEFARAIVDLAEQSARVDAVQADLDALAELTDRDADFAALADSPLIGSASKFASMRRLFESRVDELTLRFLHVLAEHDALPLLRVMGAAVRAERDARARRVTVEAATAQPMNESERQQMIGRLAGVLGAPVKLDERVDPSLIGGVVIRIGDTLFDGSVRRRLEQLRQHVIARGYHEIQSRRDLIAD